MQRKSLAPALHGIAQELHLAVALGAGDTEDLALLDLEVDGAEAVASKPRDLEEDLGHASVPIALGEGELKRPSDHERDQRVLCHPGGFERALTHPVPKDADAIGDPEHLRQPVTDVDDADACPALFEKKLFADLRDVVKITTSVKTPDQEQLRRINDVINRLVEEHGIAPQPSACRSRSAKQTRRSSRSQTACSIRCSPPTPCAAFPTKVERFWR